MRKTAIEKNKFPFRHLIFRLLLMPLLAGFFDLLLRLFSIPLPSAITPLRMAVYTGSAIAALLLMAEIIMLFGRSEYRKIICNMSVILCIIFLILSTIQFL